MLPLIAGATLYLRNRDNDRRVGPCVPERHANLASLLRHHRRRGLQCLRVVPGRSSVVLGTQGLSCSRTLQARVKAEDAPRQWSSSSHLMRRGFIGLSRLPSPSTSVWGDRPGARRTEDEFRQSNRPHDDRLGIVSDGHQRQACACET